MDAVAQTILDVASSTDPSPPVLNVVHPHPVSWNSIMNLVNETLMQEKVVLSHLPVVDFEQWFFLLKNNPVMLLKIN